MNYGTLTAADSVTDNAKKMTCFKYLFYDCCLRLRNRRPSLRHSAVRKSSLNSSEWGGESVSSQSASQPPEGRNSPTPSNPKESYRVLDEEEAFLTSTPRKDTETDGNQVSKEKKTSVPMISVIDCSEESTEEPEPEVCEKVSEVIQDNHVEEVSQCSNKSETSLFPLKEETEETIIIKVDSTEKIVSKDNDAEQPPAYESHSQLTASTERVQDVCMADVHSASAEDENFPNITVSGDVLIGLSYNYKTETLEVDIRNCRNLSPVDTKRNKSDPYVKAYLLPDRSKSGKRKTKIKKGTLNPVFDEVLKFPVTLGELEMRTLWLSVWHSQFGRNDFLGEVMIPLGHGSIENYGYKRHALNETLEKNSPALRYNGDIILSLKFLPSGSESSQSQETLDDRAKGELHVLVKEAKNLIPAHTNATSNPFCKGYLLPEKHKASKQKTAVIKKNCNPKWNHTFVYSDVTIADLRERCLELTIWSHDKIGSNHFLGGVRLGLGQGTYQDHNVQWNDSMGEEVNLWKAMLQKPGIFVDGSLLLRTQMQRTRN